MNLVQMGKVSNPPPILVTWQLCKKYNSLPYSGGILDQPSKLMDAFSIIDNIMIEFKSQGGRN